MEKETEQKVIDSPEDAYAYLDEFIEKFYGKVFDKYVKISGKPDLRNELKSQTFNFFLLRNRVEKAKDVKDLETQFDKEADILEADIQKLLKKFAIFTRESNAVIDRQLAAIELMDLESKTSAEEINREIPDLKVDFANVFVPVIEIVGGFKNINIINFQIQEDLLSAPLREFRRWRNVSYWMDIILWFVFIILIAGLGYKAFTSLIEVFLLSYVVSSIFTVLIAILFLILKDKVVNPFLKKILLNVQKRNLLTSLEKLHLAQMNFTAELAKEEKVIKKREAELNELLHASGK